MLNHAGAPSLAKLELSIYIFRNTPPTISNNTFGNTCYTWTDVYVPEDYKEKYQNTDYWRNFKSISDLSQTVDGIRYNITSPTEAKVTCLSNDEKYSGQITIPESITFTGKTFNVVAIENEAFKECSELVSVTIPNSVTSIGMGAFRGCSSLESINIPNHLTSIGDRTFMGCSSLSSIDLPDSLTYISAQSFQNCSKLYSITIPRKVSNIGHNAFAGCNRLTLVASLNETPPTLGSWGTFSISIPILLVPRGSKDTYQNNIDPNNYSGWKEYINKGCTNVLEFDFDKGEFLVLKSSYEGGKIVYNGQETMGETKVFAVNNGNDIPLNIELDANCEFISCVIDGDSIKELTREANNVFSFMLKADKGHIVDATFVEDSVVVCNNMYYKILQDNEVELFPRIGYQTSNGSSTTIYFAYRDNVVIPDSIVIPASLSHPQREYIVTGINYRAFQADNNSEYLKSVVIGNNVKSIPDRAFYNCQKLTSITIGKKVTSIGDYAFYQCTGLTSITIPNSVTNIGGASFYGCTSLTSVVIPNSVTSLGWSVFQGCTSLTSVVIPNSVTSIGTWAFEGCTNLKSVTVSWNEPLTNIGGDCFSIDAIANATLYVPVGTVEAYKNANGWKNFGKIVAPELTEDETFTTSIIADEEPVNATFKVIDAENNYVRIGNGEEPSINDGTTGNVVIPSYVTGSDGVTYQVKEIADGAFLGCYNLTSITLPQSIEDIGEAPDFVT